jgi:short-subunit dehydrogenase
MTPTGYRTALITGASSGLGRSLAARLARDGVEVVLCARRADALEEAASAIARAGGRARVLPLDVADTERTVAAIRAIDEEIGGLDLVVANAGVGIAVHGTRLTWEKIRDLCRVNFDGAIATLTAVLPQMVERRRGHLVGVSSLGALAPFPKAAGYAATKGGLSLFLDSLRLDLAEAGVHVTAVHPGAVRTPMLAYMAKEPPLMIGADEAADLIVGRLAGAPATIDFPRAMIAATRVLALLPRSLRDEALRRFPTPDENA